MAVFGKVYISADDVTKDNVINSKSKLKKLEDSLPTWKSWGLYNFWSCL